MKAYQCLRSQQFKQDDFSLVPIRNEDRYDIMNWRNEQMYHLRQTELLTKERQDRYFEQVVAKLFNQKQPAQILFSFLKGEECVGYGGLVHINWIDKNAEISFLISTEKESLYFEDYWLCFLQLIQRVAFEVLSLHKLYTYAFDVRPKLYPLLKLAGFRKDAILKEHAFFNGKPIDVHIDSTFNRIIEFKKARLSDAAQTYEWASNPKVRTYAIQKEKISWEEHQCWYRRKLKDENCFYFLIYHQNQAVGSFRLDIKKDGSAWISYLLSPSFHGRGLGRKVLENGIALARGKKQVESLVGQVFESNVPSMHLFNVLGFEVRNKTEEGLVTFHMKL